MQIIGYLQVVYIIIDIVSNLKLICLAKWIIKKVAFFARGKSVKTVILNLGLCVQQARKREAHMFLLSKPYIKIK